MTVSFRTLIPFLVLTGLFVSLVLRYLVHLPVAAEIVLMVTVAVGSLPLLIDIAKSLWNKHFGVDLLAIVAIGTAALLGQYAAAAVVLLMLSGGEAFEAYALRRARKDFSDLIAGAPSEAHKKVGSTVTDVPIEDVVPGDVVIVKPGELIPVDGEVLQGSSSVDESMLTGESILLEKVKGASVMSGSVNKHGVLEVSVLRPSSESKYEQIIRLVKEAEQQRAPFVRLADRYSVWFTAVAFILAGTAWLISGDPIRLLAVLVVATPCPLILATPIAFASGISRAAKRGIIVKSGGVFERLAQAVCFVFDKTGTLTFGVPRVVEVIPYGVSEEELVRLAASADQLSTHVLARALRLDAQERGIGLAYPDEFYEEVGQGARAIFDGVPYRVGRLSWLSKEGVKVPSQVEEEHAEARDEGQIVIAVGREDALIGVLLLEDTIRDDVKNLFSLLPQLGVEHTVMLTGDKKVAAGRIAAEVGVSPENVFAEYLPEQKVAEVERLQSKYKHVVMVGDGVNDAPALARADVGIAMGAHGSTAATEAGDVVILVDKVERVADGLYISQQVLGIAKQSIFIGIGLSIFLMFVALGGYITPIVGALLQEVIDVVVILNALRVLFIRLTPVSG